MEELREKISRIVGYGPVDPDALEMADRILAIPEIAEALNRFPQVPHGDNAIWTAPDGQRWVHDGTENKWRTHP